MGSYTFLDTEDCAAAGEHLKAVDNDGYCNACGYQDEVPPEEERSKFGATCECSDRFPGILFPTGDSGDGLCLVERCDQCKLFTDDVTAASFVGRIIGKQWKRLFDEPKKPWFKPYFDMSLEEAEAIEQQGLVLKPK